MIERLQKELDDKIAETVEKEEVIAEKNASIAEKDAEIAWLRAMLKN